MLRGAVQSTLKEILQTISERYQYEIIEQEVMPDHIPLSQAYGCTDGYGQDTEEYFCD